MKFYRFDKKFCAFLLFAFCLVLSSCTDVDGVQLVSAGSTFECEYTTSSFKANISGLPDLDCTQTSLSKSLFLGLQLLPGIELSEELNPDDIAGIQSCGGGLLLDLTCANELVLFSTTCSLNGTTTACDAVVSPDALLINSLLGLAEVLDENDVLTILETCGFDLSTNLGLADADIQCLLEAAREIFEPQIE